MSYKYEITILGLWIIAILATLLIVKDNRIFTFLGPVYFVCMLGSVITVNKARSHVSES